MTEQPPPIVPYQSSTAITPNFGMRAAKASWLAPLAGILSFGMAWPVQNYQMLLYVVVGGGALLLVAGLIASIMALALMRRYGSKGIRLPAIIGLCLNLAIMSLLVFFIIALINGLAGDVR